MKNKIIIIRDTPSIIQMAMLYAKKENQKIFNNKISDGMFCTVVILPWLASDRKGYAKNENENLVLILTIDEDGNFKRDWDSKLVNYLTEINKNATLRTSKKTTKSKS